jgi:hypothetical protein
MADWKLGTGETYATITGFTFPSDEHPDNFSVEKTKAQEGTPHYLRESIILLDKGLKEARLVLDGKFFSDTNMRNFQKQVDNTQIYFVSSGWEEKDMYFEQKLYSSDTRFYYVKAGDVQELREGRRPGSRPYKATFLMVDPFQYDDSPETDTVTGSSGTTSSMDADGDFYILPEFEFEVSSGTLTKLVIDCNKSSGTITIPCSIASGGVLKINQRTGVAQAYDSSGNLTGPAIGISGRIALRETETGITFTFTATGGSGDFTATVRPRYS